MSQYKKQKKTIISISVDEDTIRLARKKKLNVSAICNDAIKQEVIK